MKISLTLNGEARVADLPPMMRLLDALREHLTAVELHAELDLRPRLEALGPEADGDDRAVVDEEILLGLHIADLCWRC